MLSQSATVIICVSFKNLFTKNDLTCAYQISLVEAIIRRLKFRLACWGLFTAGRRISGAGSSFRVG